MDRPILELRMTDYFIFSVDCRSGSAKMAAPQSVPNQCPQNFLLQFLVTERKILGENDWPEVV
jgi:hypothetical protein